VRWVETRSENFLGMTHGRDHVTYLEVAYKRDGKILGLKVTTYANIGAYVSVFAMVVPGVRFTSMLSGTYAIPNIVGEVYGVFTNTVPVDAYRGAGRPEAAYYIERAVDLVAAELDLDPTEVRRRNFIPPFDNYYRTAIGTVYDSGDYPGALAKLLELADYPRLRAEQERLRREGRLVGIGLSTYVEVTGAGPSAGSVQQGKRAGNFESALVRVHPSGKVTVYTRRPRHRPGPRDHLRPARGRPAGHPLRGCGGGPRGYGRPAVWARKLREPDGPGRGLGHLPGLRPGH